MLDYDPAHGATSTRAADEILDFVAQEGLSVEWILDTHPHADHLMASAYLAERLGAPTAIGEKVRDIAELWSEIYNLHGAFDPPASFDRLFVDEDAFRIGDLPVRVMLSPGHTLGSITYVVGEDAAFVHDTLMNVDVGTARCDFPGGSARALYASVRKLFALPDRTRLFVGHDYCSGRDDPAWEATVAEHRARNPHVHAGVSEAEFVALREARDRTLPLPVRILAALQVNLRGGRLPDPEADGNSYLKIPLNRFPVPEPKED